MYNLIRYCTKYNLAPDGQSYKPHGHPGLHAYLDCHQSLDFLRNPLLVRFQCPLAASFVVNQRLGVPLFLRLNPTSPAVGVVNCFPLDAFELRNPLADVLSVGVKLFTLK